MEFETFFVIARPGANDYTQILLTGQSRETLCSINRFLLWQEA